MGYRRDNDPSPLKTGIVHGALSLTVFGGLALALGAGIQWTGSPEDAAPREIIALFDTPASSSNRLRDNSAYGGSQVSYSDSYSEGVSGDEPSLGVEYAEAGSEETINTIASAVLVEQGSAKEAEGIRINGKLVRPGESFGDVVQVLSLPRAPVASVTERANGLTLPRVGADGRGPADVYARPFSNPTGKPVVSLVVGGLGINATHTRSAIDELPPEVTLSFAPDAGRLQYWINRARAAGHETLIEVPMEAYDYGRMKMHPQTLLAGANPATNLSNLDKLLGRATGYFGVINYQGAKFADTEAAVRPVMDRLAERGLAFVEDGGLQSDMLNIVADQSRLRYVGANTPVDTRQTAVEIKMQLMDMENQARQKGAAMGSGFAYPITIEVIQEWTAELEQKGILLAPVSALTSVTPLEAVEGGRVKTGALSPSAVDSAG